MNTSPDESEILASLLPRNLAVQILRALLENDASIYGAQMSAMDNATRNAGEMIKKQTIALQPHAPGEDHQGTDRDHLGRRGALTAAKEVRRMQSSTTRRDLRRRARRPRRPRRVAASASPWRCRRNSAARAGLQPRATLRARLFGLLQPGDPGARRAAQGRRRGAPRSRSRSSSARRGWRLRLAVGIKVASAGRRCAKAKELRRGAHKICPYSKATRGNIPVTLK